MTVELRALLCCDLAFRDARNGSWNVIGVHDRVLLRELPASHSPLVVYWSLANFDGSAMVMVTLRDDTGSVVQAARAMIPAISGNALEYAFPLPAVPFRRAGDHTIELQVGEQVIAVRSLRVETLEPRAAT
jgi:Family of unknown function (DUF6941)